MKKLRAWLKNKEIRTFCICSVILLFGASFLLDTPQGIAEGMKTIILSKDILITDYFALAGYGAAFFNSALMMLIAMILIAMAKLPYTGLTLAAIYISAGFGLWGENPCNVLPIVLGVWIYAKVHKTDFMRYTYTAVFGGCLGPFVTELVYVLPFSMEINILCAILFGAVLGYLLVPLAIHTTSIHMGYSLFNVGFAGGSLGFILYSLWKSVGLEAKIVYIWKEGIHPTIAMGMFAYFVGTFLFGCWLQEWKISGFWKLMRHPGRSVTDFVMLEGRGNTLMNMALMGMIAELYIIVIGGDLCGPIFGCILTLFGFSAFGAHLRNYLPLLTGVVLASMLMVPELTEPKMQIASILVVGIAPIAGEFGIIAGIISAMIHIAVVMGTAQFHGGLHLYNNGFSAGWIALFMVPCLESFQKRFPRKKKGRIEHIK